MQVKPKHITQCIELLKEAKKEHPEMPLIYEPKLKKNLTMLMNDPKAYVGVNKDVSAILVLVLTEDFFSLQRCVKDLVFYSKTPGAGFRLLKEAQKWIEGWGESVYAAYLGTSTGGEDVDKMYERFGLERIGTQFKFKRGEI